MQWGFKLILKPAEAQQQARMQEVLLQAGSEAAIHWQKALATGSATSGVAVGRGLL